MWPFSKRVEQKKDSKPAWAPECEHDDWEIIDRRNFGNSSGSICASSWGTTQCKVCGKRGGWNNS